MKGTVPGNLYLTVWNPSGKPAEEEVIHSKRVCKAKKYDKAGISARKKQEKPGHAKVKSLIWHQHQEQQLTFIHTFAVPSCH